MSTTVFDLLKACEGKKLILSFRDKESDSWVLMFEGGKSLLIDSIEEISDIRAFTDRVLSEELPYAETMIALKKLTSPPTEAGYDVVFAGANPIPSMQELLDTPVAAAQDVSVEPEIAESINKSAGKELVEVANAESVIPMPAIPDDTPALVVAEMSIAVLADAATEVANEPTSN